MKSRLVSISTTIPEELVNFVAELKKLFKISEAAIYREAILDSFHKRNGGLPKPDTKYLDTLAKREGNADYDVLSKPNPKRKNHVNRKKTT